MFLLIAVVLVLVICIFLEKLLAVLTVVAREKNRRRALDALYQYQVLNELQTISRSLSGPPEAPLSERLAAAANDVKRRKEVTRAIREELDVK